MRCQDNVPIPWVGGPGQGAALSHSRLWFGEGEGTETRDRGNSPDAGPTTHMQCDLLWVTAKGDVSCQVTASLLGSWRSLAGAPHTKGMKSGVGSRPGGRGRLAFPGKFCSDWLKAGASAQAFPVRNVVINNPKPASVPTLGRRQSFQSLFPVPEDESPWWEVRRPTGSEL